MSEDEPPVPAPEWSDAAKRATQVINDHVRNGNVSFGERTCWVAIRLSDGGSDGVVYDTVTDARAHQLHETQCAYFRIPPDGATVRGVERYLYWSRKAYDEGLRIGVDDGPQELIVPLRDLGNRAARRAAEFNRRHEQA